MSVLYIIATPIGNLGDISYRAVETLKAVDIVACEDTRTTIKLLNHLGIQVPLISCRAHNERQAAQSIVAALNAGKTIAYTSDAGTPALSDPGAVLVQSASQAGHTVLPIPGVSAFSALLSVSGVQDKTIIFEGFLSPKPGRRKARLDVLLAGGDAFVVYESPFRICALLEDLAASAPERYSCLGREMTKVHEEYLRGSVAQILAQLRERPVMRGEFALLVSGYMKGQNKSS
ncbi:MAG: 16S rRNA (cytidine(1402)-2'-O)-methyltransferase [Spirochaetaceae bacterium]|jgi:16S rRNA (cytidine1402-2'-O)-methyltransferase|nr:16S rRNA (cytidine(1402)-2'-O)-methyltransferase [Spirochaetaceae bacterium]